MYGGLAVLNLALNALSIQLGAGNVPIPSSLDWTVPILSAVLVGVTTLLPRIGDVEK